MDADNGDNVCQKVQVNTANTLIQANTDRYAIVRQKLPKNSQLTNSFSFTALQLLLHPTCNWTLTNCQNFGYCKYTILDVKFLFKNYTKFNSWVHKGSIKAK